MPRLNVYLSDETYKLAERWRGKVNLSEICARALAEELEAQEAHRTGKGLFAALRAPTELERELAHHFGLADAVIGAGPETEPLRDQLGRAAAQYLSQRLGDGAQLALSGGRQMWCMVRALQPRPLRISIAALGHRPNDPRVLHAHSNTLVTLLWLLFSPRADARLVGDTSPAFKMNPLEAKEPQYFLVGSCARYDAHSPFSLLFDGRARRHLHSSATYGDFAYQFFNHAGEPVVLPVMHDSKYLDRAEHQALVRRADARVVLVAGGTDKLPVMARVLEARLCNAIVTDQDTARRLLKGKKK